MDASLHPKPAEGALGLVILTVASTGLAMIPGFLLGLVVDALGARWRLWPSEDSEAGDAVVTVVVVLVLMLFGAFVVKLATRIARIAGMPEWVVVVPPLVFGAGVVAEVAVIVLA